MEVDNFKVGPYARLPLFTLGRLSLVQVSSLRSRIRVRVI